MYTNHIIPTHWHLDTHTHTHTVHTDICINVLVYILTAVINLDVTSGCNWCIKPDDVEIDIEIESKPNSCCLNPKSLNGIFWWDIETWTGGLPICGCVLVPLVFITINIHNIVLDATISTMRKVPTEDTINMILLFCMKWEGDVVVWIKIEVDNEEEVGVVSL